MLFEYAFPPKAYRPIWRPRVVVIESGRTRGYATIATENQATRQDDKDRPQTQILKSKEWAARKQLQYLQNPYNIAQYVTTALQKGSYEEAILVTRKASNDKNVTVSWNLLIDHQCRQKKIHAGLKLFNEMKKRGQLPNAQTYTIIFRGCADSDHPRLAVLEAVNLYNQMLKLERMNPNSIHMNAVIKVCAKAKDLESMFTILQTANDGLRAPNNMTYTTVLNALRALVDKSQHGDKTESEVKAEIQTAITRAKSIWEEVISRWRSGKVVIDEELVCAMGRILLLGRHHVIDSIRDLIEQTMQIAKVPDELLGDTDGSKEGIRTKEVGEAVAKQPKTNTIIQAPGLPSLPYARPGKNSLSLILEALEKTGKTTHAIRYWGLMTRYYAVSPDAENWYRLVQVFQRGKNSARTVDYMRYMPRDLMVPKHFRSAMRTCLRDQLNTGAFANATALHTLMIKSLAYPDALTMRTYLRVAYACKRKLEQQARAGRFAEARRTYGRQLETALDNIAMPYRVVAQRVEAEKVVGVGEAQRQRQQGDEEEAAEWMRLSAARSELVSLARKMIATYDRLITGGLVRPEKAEQMKTLRNSMKRFVVAYFEQRLKFDPGFKDRDEVEQQDAKEDEEDSEVVWDDDDNGSDDDDDDDDDDVDDDDESTPDLFPDHEEEWGNGYAKNRAAKKRSTRPTKDSWNTADRKAAA